MVGVEAQLKARKPGLEDEADLTLGARLRRRRRQLRHRRIDAAQAIGTNWKSLMLWERNERAPLDRFWPAIIAYLEQEPWPEALTLGESLRAERRRRGLATFEAAAAMGVDETTLGQWERGERQPTYFRTKALASGFLRNEGR
jgi:DNA-binding XRE family transcriptional regulator